MHSYSTLLAWKICQIVKSIRICASSFLMTKIIMVLQETPFSIRYLWIKPNFVDILIINEAVKHWNMLTVGHQGPVNSELSFSRTLIGQSPQILVSHWSITDHSPGTLVSWPGHSQCASKLMSVDIMLDEEVKPWLLEVELKFCWQWN